MKTGALLIMTVGLPGSGKSYEAIQWVARAKTSRARANRDLLRIMMHGGWTGDPVMEDQVTSMQHAGVRELLRDGNKVIVDDTNLNPVFRERLVAIATGLAVPVNVWDFTGVPLAVAVSRNEQRTGTERLKDGIIAGMYERWISGPRGRGEDPLRDVRQHVTETFR